MRKIFSIVCILILGLCLTACGKDKKENQNTINNSDDNKEILDGGWNMNLDAKSAKISDEDLKIFNAATKEYTGMDFEPLVLLGKQVVAGTNYMFLCKGTTVTLEPKTSYKLVVIYNDLNGNSSITSVKDFDFNKYITAESNPSGNMLVGGWEVNKNIEEGKLDEDSLRAFNSATKTLTGMTYKPIMMLGSQIVAGKNYAILCLGTTSTLEESYSINLLIIYEDLEKQSKIISISTISLAEYNN